MNTVPKYIAYTFICILSLTFISFFFNGLISKPPEAVDYNLPVAYSILSGEFLKKQDGIYIHSPGASHTIMAAFIASGVTLNLFGLLSWIVLLIVSKKLGDTFGLNKYMSLIFAASVCMTISVIRTVGDQSIDKWLCTWFLLSLIFLEKPKKTIIYSGFLGFTLGMLVGTKYSGPLFFIALVPLYLKSLVNVLNPVRFIVLMIPFTTVGLFWYIRNFIYQGNPYYPANFLFFKGVPNFTQQDWMLWKIPFIYPENIIPLLDAYLSEYMIWTIGGFVIIWYLLHQFHRKRKLDSRITQLVALSITVGCVCLLLPITPPYKIELFHIVSDMRYIYIYMAIIILGTFIIADKLKQNNIIAMIALLNALPLYSFIPYQPKILVGIMMVAFIIYFKLKSLEDITEKFKNHFNN